MSEIDAIKRALEPVRRLAGSNNQHVAIKNAAASGAEQKPGSEISDKEPARSGPSSDDLPADDIRAEATTPGASSRDVAPHASEIELKLLVASDRLADFNDAPIIAANARNNGTRKHLKAV